MPARMIRETLLESDRFLSLPDNTARMCFVVVLLNADDRGNMEASPGQLKRVWRDFGVDSTEKAISVSQFLADQDLIRLYQADGKQYIHVPRFGQRKRHLVRACPASPWCDLTENQEHSSEDDGRKTDERQTDDVLPSVEEKGSEEKGIKTVGSRRSVKTPLPDGFALSERVISWAAEKRILNLDAHLESFINVAKARDYRYADWDRAFMNAVLKDWAGIGHGNTKQKVQW